MSSSATHLHPKPDEYIFDLQRRTIYLMQPLNTARAICKAIFEDNVIPNRSFVVYLDPKDYQLLPCAIIKDVRGRVLDAYNIPLLQATELDKGNDNPATQKDLAAQAVKDVEWFRDIYHEYKLILQEAATYENVQKKLTHTCELLRGNPDACEKYT
jgi:hypothetical protein